MSKVYDDYKSRAAARSKDRQRGKSYKLKEGNNDFRILLTPKGRTTPEAFYEFAVHENVGKDKAYLRCGCDPVTGKGKCLACQKAIPRLRKRGKESRAAELEPKQKTVVQVVEVIDGVPKGKPQLWYPSKKVADTIIGTIIPSKKRDYLSHRKGYNLSINRTGTGMQDTRYGPIEADDEPTKVSDKIVALLKPFDELAEIPKYNEKKMKIALGYSSSEDEDEDEEEVDDKESRRSQKRSRDEDDEDDDSDSDEDDSDDDEDSEDEEDDEDDEDEEDEDSDSDDSDDDDEDSESDGEEDEDDDSEDEDEDDKPVRKKKGNKKKVIKNKRSRR